MKYYYKLCGLILEIRSDFNLDDSWNRFIGYNCKASMSIEIHLEYDFYYGIEVIKIPISSLLIQDDAMLMVENNWNKAHIKLFKKNPRGLYGVISAFIMTYLSIHNRLMMHASLIDVNNKGIMFIGPSGIGKTTQAELWKEYREAIIINGDMALVHCNKEEARGYGCPWHGSSPYCENRDVKLYGIIVLEKAQENEIIRLTGLSMLERVMANVFLPKWHEEGVNVTLNTIDDLLLNVPVYLLKCRKNKAAVELVERVLFEDDI